MPKSPKPFLTDGPILALDLATKTGWAYATREAVAAWPETAYHAKGEHIDGLYSDAVVLGKRGNLGSICADAEFMLDSVWRAYGKPALIARELPFIDKRNARANARVLFGVSGAVCGWSYKANIPEIEVEARDWRKVTLGNGNLKRAAAKAAAIHVAKKFGVSNPSEDEAEAIGLLNYAIQISRRYRKEAGP